MRTRLSSHLAAAVAVACIYVFMYPICSAAESTINDSDSTYFVLFIGVTTDEESNERGTSDSAKLEAMRRILDRIGREIGLNEDDVLGVSRRTSGLYLVLDDASLTALAERIEVVSIHKVHAVPTGLLRVADLPRTSRLDQYSRLIEKASTSPDMNGVPQFSIRVRLLSDGLALQTSHQRASTQRTRDIVDRVLREAAEVTDNVGVMVDRIYLEDSEAFLWINAPTLRRLIESPYIQSIRETEVYSPQDASSYQYIGSQATYSINPATNGGSGVSVAIIDVGGVWKEHSAFVSPGKLIAEACFSTLGGGFSSACPNGLVEQVGSGAADPRHLVTKPSFYHGTAVAGPAVSGPSSPTTGMARDAKLIAINASSIYGGDVKIREPDLKSALAWLNSNYATFSSRLAVVNMSIALGTTDDYFNGQCGTWTQINSLRKKNVVFTASSGNGRHGQGGGLPGVLKPSCLKNVISVGGVYDDSVYPRPADAVWNDVTYGDGTSGTSVGVPLDVYAPSFDITIPYIYNGFSFLTSDSIFDSGWRGTSFASPIVAGAFAQLSSAFPTACVSRLESAVLTTGTPVTVAGITRNRVDTLSAYNNLLAGAATPNAPTLTKDDPMCLGAVLLMWTSASAGIVSHYEIQSSLNSNFTNLWSTWSSVELEEDTSAPYTVWYRVRACNGSLCSTWSNPSKVTYYSECP